MFYFKVNESIKLELIQHDKKEELYELIDHNREHLRKWLPWVDKRKSPADLDPIIEEWITNYAKFKGFDVAINYNGKIVGMIGAQIDNNNKSVRFGYFLSKQAEGNGIVTVSIKKLIEYFFIELNFNRIEIICAQGNKKSQGIPERLGFEIEGTKKEAQFLNNRFEDLVIFSLLKKGWKGYR